MPLAAWKPSWPAKQFQSAALVPSTVMLPSFDSKRLGLPLITAPEPPTKKTASAAASAKIAPIGRKQGCSTFITTSPGRPTRQLEKHFPRKRLPRAVAKCPYQFGESAGSSTPPVLPDCVRYYARAGCTPGAEASADQPRSQPSQPQQPSASADHYHGYPARSGG